MANIIVKESPSRRDPKHTGQDPNYQRWRELGERKWETMQHEMSEAEKRDYIAKVKNNPHNVIGQPALFPAIPLFSSLTYMHDPSEHEKEIMILEKLHELDIIDEEFWCNKCDALTVHSLSGSDCFCKKCGDPKPYRRTNLADVFSKDVLALIEEKKKNLT